MPSPREITRALSGHTGPAGASVLIANAPGLRVVDFNRPEALNALNGEMVDTLGPLVYDWQQDKGDVFMVVFRLRWVSRVAGGTTLNGTGHRVF